MPHPLIDRGDVRREAACEGRDIEGKRERERRLEVRECTSGGGGERRRDNKEARRKRKRDTDQG